MKPSYSDARKATALATSLALPALWIGMPSIVLSADSFEVCVLWKEVPRISPGAMALTRVPCGPSSLAKARLNVRMAPLLVE